MISTIRPNQINDAAFEMECSTGASVDMLEIVGSERCLEILSVLNDVFDSLECESTVEDFASGTFVTNI